MKTGNDQKSESLMAVKDHLHSPFKKEWPDFGIGDTIKVHNRIKEGDKSRIQIYEGVVISIRGEGLSKTFVVRRVTHEVGVERIFPFHSPSIEKIQITRKGKVRRAKLYYLRHKSGKSGRIKESREAQAKMIAEEKAARGRAQKKKKSEETAAQQPPVAESAPTVEAPENVGSAETTVVSASPQEQEN